MSRHFSIGDRVRCIENEDTYVSVGAIGVIINTILTASGNIRVRWEEGNFQNSCFGTYLWYIRPSRFELVESREVSLDTLIKRANMGFKALDELYLKHSNDVVISNDMTSRETVGQFWNSWDYNAEKAED